MVKITKRELRELQEGARHSAAIKRLAAALDTVPREQLASLLAGQVLMTHGGDEAAAREQLYRILTVIDAINTGAGIELQDEAPPPPGPDLAPSSLASRPELAPADPFARVFQRVWAQCGDCDGRGCRECDGIGELLIHDPEGGGDE